MTRWIARGLNWHERCCCSEIFDKMVGVEMGVGGKVMGELDEAVAAWQREPVKAPYCVRWAYLYICVRAVGRLQTN